MKKNVLGIAGFIGSGKSLAASYFSELGAFYIDADKIVDQMYLPGAEGYRKLHDFFGEDYFTKNGELNRKKLAKDIFNDPKKLRILHSLIHPLVTNAVQQLIDKTDADYFVLEAIYFEKKYLQKLVSAILWLDCPKKTLFERLQKERGLDEALFEKILRFQFKPERVDYVIENTGTKAELKMKVEEIWRLITE